MRLGELFENVGIECPDGLEQKIVSGIVTDSRKAFKDCIFVCVRGLENDGHRHIEEAIKAGAAVIVAENVRGVCVGGAAIVLVENTRHTASLLYNAWYGEPTKELKIIGVTGTNGKTSVTLMLKQIFERAGYSCGLLGTVGYFSVGGRKLSGGEMTTPDPETLYRSLRQIRDDGGEYVFMEVSSHALAQSRTDAIIFDTAVFTNLTEDHLDFHASMEAYYKAKEKIFSQCRRAVVNIDDAAGRRIFRSFEKSGIEIKSCSADKGDFCALFGKSLRANRSEYALKTENGIYRVSLPLSGEFQIMNSLEAAAVALMHGIPIRTVREALGNMPTIPGRMELVRAHERQSFDIFIDYAHTPDALEKLLKSVRSIKRDNGRLILLFGCGGERETEKRKTMGQIASRLADTVIITSDNSRREDTDKIISDILRGIDKEKEYTIIKDRREAIEQAISRYVRQGDVLVLAGKGHEKYQIDASGKHDFDERQIINEALIKLYEK